MTGRRILAWLLAGAISLPAAITICCAFAWALLRMADAAGAMVLNRVALGLGVVWVLDLVALLLLVAWQQLIARDELDNDHE
jgi:hypothetical protein